MDRLSPSVEDFLNIVGWVSELVDVDAELSHATKTLWSRLERAEDQGDTDLATSTIHKLGMVGDLRGEIARELRIACDKAGLQVLGQPAGPAA